MSGIHKIVRDTSRRLYCGPTAICALTGLPASRVLAEIDKYRGGGLNAGGRLKGVRGMSIGEVQAILQRLGFVAVRKQIVEQPTVAARLAQLRAAPTISAPRIIRIRGHFIAVGADAHMVCDTKTKQPVRAKQCPKRRARVTDEIIILAARSEAAAVGGR